MDSLILEGGNAGTEVTTTAGYEGRRGQVSPYSAMVNEDGIMQTRMRTDVAVAVYLGLRPFLIGLQTTLSVLALINKPGNCGTGIGSVGQVIRFRAPISKVYP